MYKLFPKSNSKLEVGQFWPIKLSNGQFAIGIVLDLPDKHQNTKHFFAGLLNWIGDTIPTQIILEKINHKLIDQGKAHIKTITFDGEGIIGKIDLDLLKIVIPFEVSCFGYSESAVLLQGYKTVRKSTPEDHKIYKTQGGWGFDYINELAEQLLTEK
ncbi:Imm26 family immunity protein [Ferruginibacter sp. SUN106]|uniref:Imm26 family immunity protein n=1 Tax=Ferruginibacter sp. SUN106 TaxID=2978348 RepID=UPI003D35CE23